MTAPEASWRAALEDGRLLLQRGVTSGKAFFPPRLMEPGTGDSAEWFEAAPGGTIYSVTVIGQKPPLPLYNVVLVDLDDGVRMMGRVDGLDPHQVRIGMRVTARIAREDDAAIIVFDPAQ